MSLLELRPRRATADFDLEGTLVAAIDRATAPPCPPRLGHAIRHAVLPGGARIRPRLTLAVAEACGLAHPQLALAGAVAVELLHSASLVHDDLPMFDDADERRGRPSVHRAYGQPLAVLAGDALIVLAFEVLAHADGPFDVAAAITRAVASSVGAPRGIVAGQAWESEPDPELATYHRAKTGALFSGAVTVGALAGGGEPAAWARLAARIGDAYQIQDDLQDVRSTAAQAGKPVGRDVALGRPNIARALGVEEAERRLASSIDAALDSVPLGPSRPRVLADLRAMLER